MKCNCQGERGPCWAWLVPADPSHVQPHALWLWKLGCYVPCSLGIHVPSLLPDTGGQPVGLALAQHRALFLLVLSFPGSAVLRQA